MLKSKHKTAQMWQFPLTSYDINPEGTNSGALAESFDDLTKESASLLPLEPDAQFDVGLGRVSPKYREKTE